jgi:Rieske Fe-S protein
MEETDRKRRRLVAALIAAAGAVFFLGRFFRPLSRTAEVRLDVPHEPVPADGALVYARSRVALVRDGDRIQALDLTCTHLGCTVTVTPTELVCPCHGSRFDRQGQVLEGPAQRPLKKLTLQEREDRWVVTA